MESKVISNNRKKIANSLVFIVNRLFNQNLHVHNINQDSDNKIPFDKPLIIYSNHIDIFDSFAIHEAFRRIAPLEHKSNAFLQPVMRDNFFGKYSNLINPIFDYSGVILIDLNSRDREKINQYVNQMISVLESNGNLWIFPSRTRSKNGELLYTKDNLPLSDPITISKRYYKSDKTNEEVYVVPVNYTKDFHTGLSELSPKITIRFGKPIPAYEVNKKNLPSLLGEISTVNISQVAASLIYKKLNENKSSNEIHDVETDIKNIMKELDYKFKDLSHLNEINLILDKFEMMKIIEYNNGRLIKGTNYNDIIFLSNQVKHVTPLQEALKAYVK
jgi:1-acyl-sn-glycerol-3-phosphate acyltransferase